MARNEYRDKLNKQLNKATGSILKQLRAESGMTLAEVRARTGITEVRISNWENQHTFAQTDDDLLPLISTYGLTLDEFWSKIENVFPSIYSIMRE